MFLTLPARWQCLEHYRQQQVQHWKSQCSSSVNCLKLFLFPLYFKLLFQVSAVLL